MSSPRQRLMVRDWGAEKTTLAEEHRADEADSVLPADPGAPSTRTVIITPGPGSARAEPAGLGAQDLQGGQGAAAADPHAGAGDQRAKILTAAERAGPAGVLALADPAVPALDRADPLLEFLLDLGGVDAEIVQDPAGGRARVQGYAEQQVLGPELGLAAPGGQPPRPGDRLLGLPVPDNPALLA